MSGNSLSRSDYEASALAALILHEIVTFFPYSVQSWSCCYTSHGYLTWVIWSCFICLFNELMDLPVFVWEREGVRYRERERECSCSLACILRGICADLYQIGTHSAGHVNYGVCVWLVDGIIQSPGRRELLMFRILSATSHWGFYVARVTAGC